MIDNLSMRKSKPGILYHHGQNGANGIHPDWAILTESIKAFLQNVDLFRIQSYFVHFLLWDSVRHDVAWDDSAEVLASSSSSSSTTSK